MRLVKVTYLAIVVFAWWLTINGHLGAPVSRAWFVTLLGLSLGFLFGCMESRTTYRTDHLTAWWTFLGDSGWVFVLSLIVMLVRVEMVGLTIALLPFATTASFVYIAWPRYITTDNPRRLR